MGLFDFFQSRQQMDLSGYESTPGAILLDVRTPAEYRQGHIPASQNLPLQTIATAPEVFPDKNTPLFVYCQSGARSKQAADALTAMGYLHVTNLGGINAYTGKVER